MSLVVVAIALFLMLELGNIFMLYFKKDSTRANGIGTFKAWEKSKSDPAVNDLVKYLANWVAGTKIFFVSLLTVMGTACNDNLYCIILCRSLPTRTEDGQ